MDVFRPNDTFLWDCNHSPSHYTYPLRLVMVAVIGTLVVAFSLLSNLSIIYIFQTSERLRRQNYANPVILAAFDMLVSVCYMFIVVWPTVCVYYRFHWGMLIWSEYIRYVYLFRHFCESMCNFLLLMASIERLLGYNSERSESAQRKTLIFIVRNRKIIFCILIIVSVTLKGTLYFETDVITLDHCGEIDLYAPIQVSYFDEFAVFRFWCRKLISVIMPFFVLVFCNYKIMRQFIKRRRRNAEQSIRQRNFDLRTLPEDTYQRLSQDKKGVKSATLTLIMVVACYLISNSLTLVVSVIEFFNVFLIQRHYTLFVFITDCSWLLTILGCAFRIFIYIFSDQKMKKALARAIFRFRIRALPSKELEQHQLDRLSMQGVSNSLRSNLTNAEAPARKPGTRRKVKEELGTMVDLRRNFIVNVTMRLGSLVTQVMGTVPATNPQLNERELETHDDWLTDIQEEDSSHVSRRDSRYRSICAETHLLSTEEMDENEQVVEI